MSVEENKQLIRRFYDDIVNAGRLEAVDELVAEGFVEHENFPGLEGGREGLRQFVVMLHTAFPDIRIDVHDILADGDRIAVRSSMRGTHRGDFMGIAPTGKVVDVPMMDVIRIENGMAAEHWGVTDTAAMMQQLGAMPGA
jgi:steroid delta-isomerase-like uncharacterized protein